MASAKSQDDAKPVGAAVPLDAAVFGAAVQLPVLDKMEPDAWFAVMDANFALRKVTDSTTRYYYVLSKLDSTLLWKLSMFLKLPRGQDPYNEIRAKLCKVFEAPMEQKLDALLATESIGDERPSEFGMELQRLADAATMDDILKWVFLRSLLPAIVTAITGSLSASFDIVVEAADHVWTAAAKSPTASVSAISRPQGPPTRGGKRGGRQRGARAAASGQVQNVNLCSFHRKFGDAARKCATGCSRWCKDRPRDSQAARVFHVEEALDGEDTQDDAALGND